MSVKRDGDDINLIMAGNITFACDGHQLNADVLQVLDSLVLVLNEYKKTIIVVAGHTDSQGSNNLIKHYQNDERQQYRII
jgi:outer membrane protein OmpA-like peptidoglycan-associated protein